MANEAPYNYTGNCMVSFIGASDSKETVSSAGDLGLIPGWENQREGMLHHSNILAWKIA